MSFTIKTKVGVHQIEVTGNNFHEALQLQTFLSSLPNECPVCGSKVGLFHVDTQQGYDYYGLKCRPDDPQAQTHETTFGERKKDNKFWYKGEWHNTGSYKGGDDEPPQREQQQQPPRGQQGQQRQQYPNSQRRQDANEYGA